MSANQGGIEMLKPLQNYVILKREKEETMTASGILLTSPQEQAKNQATVVAIGPKCDNLLKEGQQVVFKEYSGTSYSLHDEEYMILKEEDILAIIE